MSQVNGVAAIWGVNGIVCTGIAINPTVASIESGEFAREADEDELRDSDNDVVGLAISNQRKTLRLTVFPLSSSGTIATARANLDALMPTIGSSLTLADGDSSITDATHGGKYVVRSPINLRRANRGFAGIELNLYQSEAQDLTVVAS